MNQEKTSFSKGIKSIKMGAKMALVMMMVFALLPLGAFASSGPLQYTGKFIQGTDVVLEQDPKFYQHTKLFELKSQSAGTDALYQAYCAQWEKEIKDGTSYYLNQLSAYTPQHAKVRAILANSYPNISVSEFASRSGAAVYNEKDAIAATQLALWNVIQKATPLNHNDNPPAVLKAYTYLINLPGQQAPSAVKLAAKDFKITQSGNQVIVKFKYGTNDILAGTLDADYVFSVKGFKETSSTVSGTWTEVVLSKTYANMNCVDRFDNATIKIYGKQYFKDAMALVTCTDSQNLVVSGINQTYCLNTQCYRLPCFTIAKPWTPYSNCGYNVYYNGNRVTYNGRTYQCIQGHYVYNPTWNPANSPSLWKLVD